jgi:hypothetical protein
VTPNSERTAVLEPSTNGVASSTPAAPTGVQARRRLTVPRIGLTTHVLPALILALPILGTALVFWPGHMSADTLDEAAQAMSGNISNIHAGLLVYGWHILWPLGVGPGWLLFGQLLAFCLGVYLIFRAIFSPLWAAILTALVSFAPPVFGELAHVGRDMWFLGFNMMTFGCLVRAVQRPWPTRGWWLGATVVFAWLTLAARQNAASTVFIALIGVAWLVLVHSRWRTPAGDRRTRIRRGVLAGLAGCLLTIVLMGTQTGLSDAIGIENANPQQYGMLYDVAGLSVRENKDLFPKSILPPSKFAVLKANWNVDSVDSLDHVANPLVPVPLPEAQYKALQKKWISDVAGNPGSYLGVRTTLFLRELAITRKSMWIFHPVIDPNTFGYQTKFPKLDNAADNYVKSFANANLDGGIVFTVWVYLLITIAACVVLLRRTRGPALLVVGGLALSALTIQIGFYLAAMGTAYRFEHGPVVIALMVTAVMVKLAVDRLAARRRDRVATT